MRHARHGLRRPPGHARFSRSRTSFDDSARSESSAAERDKAIGHSLDGLDGEKKMVCRILKRVQSDAFLPMNRRVAGGVADPGDEVVAAPHESGGSASTRSSGAGGSGAACGEPELRGSEDGRGSKPPRSQRSSP